MSFGRFGKELIEEAKAKQGGGPVATVELLRDAGKRWREMSEAEKKAC